MTAPSLSKTLRRLALSLCLALSFTVLVAPLRADDIPKFADPAVGEYCKKFSDLADDMITAIKTKDETKANAVMASMSALQADAGAIGSKLKPDEIDKFSKFMQAQATKLSKAE